MAKVEVNQFEGCLLGGLLGDCLGSPYMNDVSHTYPEEKIQTFFDDILKNADQETITYTDDTSMSNTLVQSLINCETFDVDDLAKRFTEAYYVDRKGDRGCHYGTHVRAVFYRLKSTTYQDVFEPASKQFNGEGSMGNGSGMRISPVALYTITDSDLTRFTEIAVQTSRITHTHPNGIVGGIFQALAVRHGLLFGIKRKEEKVDIDPFDILNEFEKDFMLLATGKIELPSKIPSFQSGYTDYMDKLKTIRKLLLEGNHRWTVEKIKSCLGVKVAAVESIPTAFFCFLAAFSDIPFVTAENQFHRTVHLAVALGGDTDTIGAMAGAIAGGFLGRSQIPEKFITICEDNEGVTELAKKLFKKTVIH